jgi:hypothetical protein
MNETKNDYHQQLSHSSKPYWQRAHRDWRLWVGVIAMMIAMAVYITTNNLAGWRGQGQPQPAASPGGL